MTYDRFFKDSRCLNCDQYVDDYDAHLAHRSDCMSFVQRRLRYWLALRRRDRHGLGVARPIEKKLLDENIKNDRSKWRLRQNYNTTGLIMREIKHIVKDDDVIVAEILGAPASGKSVSGLALAVLIILEWIPKLIKEGVVDAPKDEEELWQLIKSKIHIGHNHGDTSRLTRYAKRGDVIVQDEDPDAVGGGAVASKKDIENILKIMRIRCVSYIFISPVSVPYLHTVNFRMETYEKFYRKRLNQLVGYDRKNDALGWVFLKILTDENPIMKEYLEKKIENVEQIAESGGTYSTGYDMDAFREDVQRLYKYIEENYDVDYIKSMTKQMLNFYSEGVIPGRGDYQKMVADEVYYHLKKNYKVKIGEIDQSGEYNLFMNNMDSRVLQKIYDYAQPNSLPEELGKAYWKYRIIDGEKVKACASLINEEFDRDSTRTYYSSDCFSAFQENCLGEAAEKSIHELYYSNCERRGGQSEPDLVGDDFIVEIKARYQLSTADEPTIDINSIIKGESYLRAYFDEEYPVKIILIDYDANKGRVLGYDRVY